MLASARPPSKRFLALALCAAATSCGSPKDAWIAGRILDPCGGSWPVCNTVVGCPLDSSSYAEGKFPGTAQYLVQTPGPATVTIHLFLDEVTAAGSEATLTWFETGCTSRFQTQVTGAVFVGESQNLGEFQRSEQLAGAGDHLIQIQSDATASYSVKVDIVPTE
ncbi:MAG: hypothetical protein ACYCWW_09400 [Deltaproteobacteria bacterium]